MNHLPRRDFLSAGAGAAAWLASACGRRADRTRRKIVVSARPNLYMAAFYLAQDRGYFQQAGLDLDLQPLDEGYQTAALLAGGKLDIAFSALTSSMISAVGSGADLRIVAGMHRLTADCSDSGRLWGNRASFPRGLDNLATLKRDLTGRSVALNSLSSTNNYYLHLLLDKAGIPESDIKIVAVRYSEAVTAVINGRLDAFMCADQFSTQKVSESPRLVRGVGLVEILPGLQYRFVSFGKNLLHADPDVGARFLRAYFKGVVDFRNGLTPGFLDQFARSNSLDVDRARGSCRANAPVDGEIDDESIRGQVEWYFHRGFSPRDVTVSEIVDRRFLERALKEGA